MDHLLSLSFHLYKACNSHQNFPHINTGEQSLHITLYAFTSSQGPYQPTSYQGTLDYSLPQKQQKD